MRVVRYTDKMINEFVDNGYWTDETFYEFWEKNAETIPDKTALVDSTCRLTWKEAKIMTDQIAADRKSTRLNSSHIPLSRMPSSA